MYPSNSSEEGALDAVVGERDYGSGRELACNPWVRNAVLVM
jgi:hypothetical protein